MTYARELSEIASAITVDGSKNIGIGPNSPIAPLTVASSTTLSAGAPSVVLQGGNNTERFAVYASGGTGAGTSVFLAASARGTIASPTAVQANDGLGYFQFGGHDSSGYSRSAWISGLAAENYSATNRGSVLTFATTPIGSTAIAERMRIDSSGYVTLPGSTASAIYPRLSVGTGTGAAGLTVNDGYGNANVAFNHTGGTPDASGSSGRITCNVDGTPAGMTFALADNTTVGVPVGLTTVLTLTTAGATFSVPVSGIFPTGTRMPFAQAAAPTGWTQDTSDNANNRMLRVVSTGGGGVGGSASPILNNVVPAHTHGFTTGTVSANHTHSGNTGTVSNDHQHLTALVAGVSTGYGINGALAGVAGSTYTTSNATYTSGFTANHTHAFTTGTISANHTHSGSTDNGSSQTNWSPRYIDMIICSKT